jgi:hypothetical protein
MVVWVKNKKLISRRISSSFCTWFSIPTLGPTCVVPMSTSFFITVKPSNRVWRSHWNHLITSRTSVRFVRCGTRNFSNRIQTFCVFFKTWVLDQVLSLGGIGRVYKKETKKARKTTHAKRVWFDNTNV